MELKINNENKKNMESQKYKDLLISLIKQKLDNKLSKLERRNKMHLTLLNITTQTVKDISQWAINANKQITEKYKKNKPTTQVKQKVDSKNKKFEKIEIRSNTRKQSLRSKTPLRNKSTKSFIPEESKTLTTNRNYLKSNKYFNINNINPKSEKIDPKIKSNSFIIKKKKRKSINDNNLNLETEVLRRPSVMSNKSNKTTTSKKNKNAETPQRKKTPFKKKNINDKIEKYNLAIKLNENKSSENIINSKIIKKTKKKKDDIMKMENALQKGEFLTNDDPLLIAPITDFDFFIDKKFSNMSITNSEKKEIEKINSLFNNLEEKIINIIFVFLNKDDLMQFKDVSKYFHKLFIKYIEKNLEEDKLYFSKKLENLNISNPQSPKKTLNDFSISKKSMKAIQLLNEPSVNQFFFENISVDDKRLIIYRIFFQLIKHPYKNIEIDKKELFWEKCRYYFSHESNGKVGELLQNIIDEKKICIDGNNLYKIYKIVYKDFDRINPQYFSNICGITGLITFIIKDILDFVGISNKESIQINAYWTYNDIIDDLNNKIEYIKNSKII